MDCSINVSVTVCANLRRRLRSAARYRLFGPPSPPTHMWVIHPTKGPTEAERPERRPEHLLENEQQQRTGVGQLRARTANKGIRTRYPFVNEDRVTSSAQRDGGGGDPISRGRDPRDHRGRDRSGQPRPGTLRVTRGRSRRHWCRRCARSRARGPAPCHGEPRPPLRAPGRR